MERELGDEARQRGARIAAFRAELAALEREGGLSLTAEQRVGLEAHLEGVLSGLERRFGIDAGEPAVRLAWGMRIATLLGGAAFFAAAVLLLHRIWGLLSTAAHATILTVVPLLFLGAAEAAFRRRVALYYTNLLLAGALLSFVLGLTTLGEIYNVAPSPHALGAWAAFALLGAYAFGARLLLGAGLLLACAYVAALGLAWRGNYWASILQQPAYLVPPAVVCYGLPSLGLPGSPRGFDTVYRGCGALVGLLALLILSMRSDLCCSGVSSSTLAAGYQILGVALGMGVTLHGLRLGRGSLVNLGAAGFVTFLFVRLHAWWWSWMPQYLFFFAVGSIAFGLLFLFRRLRSRLPRRASP